MASSFTVGIKTERSVGLNCINQTQLLFNLGTENGCCAKALQYGCLAFMTSPPTIIKMQARASYQMFMRNSFGDWMARYIDKTILVFILYNLTSYAHSRPMKHEILPLFNC